MMGSGLSQDQIKVDEQSAMGHLNSLVYSMRKTLAHYLNPDKELAEEPVTRKEHEKLYESYERSFGAYMPYAGYDNETQIFTFDDGVNSAMVFDVKPVPTEGRSELSKEETGLAILKSLAAAFPEEPTEDGEWVIQQYRWKDDDLEAMADETYEYADAYAKESPFCELMLKGILKKQFRGMSQGEGLFRDSAVTGQPFIGGIERTKVVIYRKVGKVSGKKKRSINTAKELQRVARGFEISMRAAGIDLVRNTDFDFFYWLIKFFNQRPEGVNGKSFLEGIVPRVDNDGLIPPSAKSAMFMNRPRYDSEENVYHIGDTIHKLIRVNGLSGVPATGQLTGEITTQTSVSCLTDQMPAGTMMCMTSVFVSKDDLVATTRRKEQMAQSDLSSENETMRDSCQHHRKVLSSKGSRATMTSLVFYVRGSSMDELFDRTSEVNTALINSGLTPIVERKYVDPLAANAFIYNLPMCFDPTVKTAKQCLIPMYLSDVVNMSFFFGREVGSGNPLLLMFNRSGSILTKDPLLKKDRQANAHMLVTGTTGAGKSATLVYLSLLLVAIKRPRLYIIEAGGSFRHVIEFFKMSGLTTNKVTIMPSDVATGYKCPRLAPMADASLLVDDGVVRLTEQESKIAQFNRTCGEGDKIKYVLDELEILDIPESEMKVPAKDAYLDEADKMIKEHKLAIKAEMAADPDDESLESEQKDRLGELELIAFSMATGGMEKEIERYYQSDKRYLRKAIMNVGKLSYINNETSNVTMLSNELYRLSAFQDDNAPPIFEDQRRRLNEMASAISIYTEGFEGELINEEPDTDSVFPDVDVTVIDLGTCAKPGNEALLGIVYVSLLQRLNGLAEKYQMTGRHLIKITDECHLVTKNVLTALYIVKVIKLWRKLNSFAWMATQNLNDFPGEAEKMLSMMEWIMMLLPNSKEVDLLDRLRPLSDEQVDMALAARKQDRAYTEGCLYGADFNALFRCVQPSESLAMAGTDGEEKKEIAELSKQYKCDHFSASLIKAVKLDQLRNIEPIRYNLIANSGVYDELEAS